MNEKILPQTTVAIKNTAFNVPMSHGASRFWRWIDARGIYLGTFSTDACVDLVWTELVRARDDLQAAIDANHPDRAVFEDVMAYLVTIMRRGTAHSIHTMEQARNAGKTSKAADGDEEEARVRALLGV